MGQLDSFVATWPTDANPTDKQFRAYAQVLQALLGNFKAHHSIEEYAMFPKIAKVSEVQNKRVALLENDHHVLDSLMEQLNQYCNTHKYQELRCKTPDFCYLMNRHLEDEEDIIIPLMLQNFDFGNW
mmetsp:Transcript_79376/g.171557  ORF Transcript_79376/g.171557 Transcript_79376/m.171557 type:complete len:127 (-) Transcript_79376:104-484(-)